VVFQKNHEDFFAALARVAKRSVARMYGAGRIETSNTGFKKRGLSNARIEPDESPERSLAEDGLSKFYD
jgi:hypothetical protein